MYKDSLDAKALEYLDYIMAAADRMATQITDLLDHAKLGKNVEREDIDLNQLLEVVKYDLGKSINEKKAQINAGNLPKLVGYKTELRLLFQNLISNALKYTATDAKPIIKINAQMDPQSTNHWLFSITDNGVGIPAEDLDRIFFIFNRLESNTKLEGHGVGLSHCQKIVNLHEGRIWATSKVGEGSTFFFTLKMYDDD